MENAELYRQCNQLQLASAKYFIDIHGDTLKENFKNEELTLLDVGSGCGTVLTVVFVGKSGLNVQKIFGTDVSPEMITFARKNYSSERITFDFLDIEGEISKEFQTVKLDIITSCFSLNRIKDVRKGLENVHSLLKPGGVFSCVFLASHSLFEIFRSMKGDPKYSKHMPDKIDILPPLCFEEKADEILKKYFNDLEMKVLKFEDRFFHFDYETEETFVAAMKSVYSFLQHIPEHLESDFFIDFIKALKKLNIKNQSNPFNVPCRVINFIVQKSK